MPNCAPSKLLTSRKKQHGRYTGETDAARMWALARFPVATTMLEDTQSRRLSRSGKQWSGYLQELRTEPRGRANIAILADVVPARRFTLHLYVLDLRSLR